MKPWSAIRKNFSIPMGCGCDEEPAAGEPHKYKWCNREYRIPELGHEEFLIVQQIRAGEPTEYDGADPDQSWRLVMGAAWDQMAADNAPVEAMGRAGLATLAFFEKGPEIAEAIWENGIDPKALAAAIQSRTEPQPPSSTDAANATRSRASTSGTSSRPTSSKKPRAKASRS